MSYLTVYFAPTATATTDAPRSEHGEPSGWVDD